jgi:hypothetical protein
MALIATVEVKKCRIGYDRVGSDTASSETATK